jgi:hypothetical protein
LNRKFRVKVSKLVGEINHPFSGFHAQVASLSRRVLIQLHQRLRHVPDINAAKEVLVHVKPLAWCSFKFLATHIKMTAKPVEAVDDTDPS